MTGETNGIHFTDQNTFGKHCPPGFRLLFQLVGNETKEQAWTIIRRTFGAKKAFDAAFRKGAFLPSSRIKPCGRWIYKPNGGWMFFVPIDAAWTGK
jgi:hypothetical protein